MKKNCFYLSFGRFCYTNWLVIALTSLAIFSSPSSLGAAKEPYELPQSLIFDNNGQTQRLQLVDPETANYRNQFGQTFRLAKGVIVKTLHTAALPTSITSQLNLQDQSLLAELSDGDMHLLQQRRWPSQKDIDLLSNHPNVQYVQPNLAQVRRQSSYQTTDSTEEPESPHINHALPWNNTPLRPKLAIIDDGFDLQLPKNTKLKLLFTYDADARTLDVSPKSSLDRHGNTMLDIISSPMSLERDDVSPFDFVLIRQSSSWTANMVVALEITRRMKADIINLSWSLSYLPEPLQDVMTNIHANDAIIVVAAGNQGKRACINNALSTISFILVVGAENAQNEKAHYSNFGQCVDIYAPAKVVALAAENGMKRTYAGTSASAAWVSRWLGYRLASGISHSDAEIELQNEKAAK